MERALARAFEPLGLLPVGNIEGDALGFDFATADRSTIVQLKATFTGPPRELAARATKLALACRSTGARWAIIAWWSASFSAQGIRHAWEELLSVFADDVTTRLQLVLVSPLNDVIYPANDLGKQIAAALRTASAAIAPEPVGSRPDRSYDVLKVLLLRWLRGDPPISMGELQAQTGLTHPTVSKRIHDLGNLIERTSNRSVKLREFPTRLWAELVALSPRVRQTTGFEDRSGRSGDLSALVARIQRQRPPHVALGGVVGARHWQSDFDLVGIPRVDLELHAPMGRADLRFVSRIDPALVPVRPEVAPILAVHIVTRAVSLFENHGKSTPWADPVEILLDLHQLRLHKQADDFMRYWRKRQ
jgi:hypothetical protein